jgi:hypothetical protein
MSKTMKILGKGDQKSQLQVVRAVQKSEEIEHK